MQLKNIDVKSDFTELASHQTEDLPMQVYTDAFGEYALKYINWHLHYEFEFFVLLQGTVLMEMPDTSIVLKAGEGIFINSKVLHQTKPLTNPYATNGFSIIFSPNFLASAEQGQMFNKYIAPALSNYECPYLLFREHIDWQRGILHALQEIYELDSQKPYGYEMIYHYKLLKVWHRITQNTPICAARKHASAKSQINRERLNRMIDYIKAHFKENITVKDIAHAANISSSECFRCFHTGIGVNPYAYFMKYRTEQAALLLSSTQMTVTEIALTCGFSSPSHFGMAFKKLFQTSPSHYRRMNSR